MRTPSSEVVLFGEAMMAFFGPLDAPLSLGHSVQCSFVGAESNVAIGLSRLGHRARFLGALGDDPFGREIRKSLAGEGVDAAHLALNEGEQTGVLFQSRRGWAEPEVLYYRRNSAFANLNPASFTNEVFEGARLALFGGIAPALGEGPRTMTHQLFAWAKERGVPVWFDLNYRSKLWMPDAARQTLRPLVAQSMAVLASVAEAQLLLETEESRPSVLAAQLRDLGPQIAVIKCGVAGSLWADEGGEVCGQSVPLSRVVSPIGAGDAFAAGLLSGVLDGTTPATCLQRAHALAAMVCLCSGDWEGLPRRADLEAFQNGHLEAR